MHNTDTHQSFTIIGSNLAIAALASLVGGLLALAPPLASGQVIAYESSDSGNIAFVESGGDSTDTGKDIDPGQDGGYVGRVADFDDDGSLEIPAGTPDGEILLIDASSDASTDTLAMDARGSNNNGPSALAVGDVTATGVPQVIYAESSGNIKRVGPQGSASEIASSSDLDSDGAGAILGYGDFNEDGDSDIVYLDTGGGVRYYDDGNDTGVSAAAGNTNAGGDLADYDLDGTLEVAIVNSSSQIELVDQTGTDHILRRSDGTAYDVVTAKPVGAVGWRDDDSLEVAHRNGNDSGNLYTIGIDVGPEPVQDASSNSISASINVGVAGDTGAGGTFTTGTNITSVDLLGTNGNEGNPDDQGSLGGDAGWRMIGPPVGGATAGDLKSPVDTDGPVIEFNLTSGDDMFYKWNDSGSDGGNWTAVSSGGEPLVSGRGYLLFLFDDAGRPNADPISPKLTLYADAGTEPSGDVTADTLDTDADFHLLANPYNQAFDLESLVNASGRRLDESESDFASAVQIWDGGDSSGESEATQGSYVKFNVGTSSGEMIDNVEDREDGTVASAWQAFFVQRTEKTDNSDSQLTFQSAGQTARDTTERDIVGDEKSRAPGQEPALIGFKLTVENSGGTQVARDVAASLYFHPEATPEADDFDASKLTPLTYPYATVGPVGPTAAGDTAIKAQESRPMDAESPLEVPFRVQTAGSIEGTARLRATQWHKVPSGWAVTLIDTKGTKGPDDDVETALTRSGASGYTFEIDAQEKRAITRWHPTRLGGASRGTPMQGTSTPRPRRPEALRLADAPESRALSPADSIPRFKVRVEGTGDRLPVELAAFDARVKERRARLSWQTAGETNNAGFYVQHRPLSSGEEATTPAEWSSLGFVEGAGTTDQSRQYAFETEELSPGPHAFRLRQVDTGGRAVHSKPLEVTVSMEASHMVSGPSPNPVQGSATLDVAVRRAQDVEVALYNVLGQRVATAYRGTLPGEKTKPIRLDASTLSSGVYFVRVDGEEFTATKRVTVVR